MGRAHRTRKLGLRHSRLVAGGWLARGSGVRVGVVSRDQHTKGSGHSPHRVEYNPEWGSCDEEKPDDLVVETILLVVIAMLLALI